MPQGKISIWSLLFCTGQFPKSLSAKTQTYFQSRALSLSVCSTSRL